MAKFTDQRERLQDIVEFREAKKAFIRPLSLWSIPCGIAKLAKLLLVL
jgi:hypothetical protein